MNYQSLRCLVTGGAGFIGSALVKRLVDCGAGAYKEQVSKYTD